MKKQCGDLLVISVDVRTLCRPARVELQVPDPGESEKIWHPAPLRYWFVLENVQVRSDILPKFEL
jgi:hypothetical protein